MRKPKSQGWRFVPISEQLQHCYILIPCHFQQSYVANIHSYQKYILSCNWFMQQHSLAIKLANTFLTSFWKKNISPGQQGFRVLLKVLISHKFWKIWIIWNSLEVLLCCNMWMTCFLTLLPRLPIGESTHLLKLYPSRYTMSPKKNCNLPTQAQYLGHLLLEAELHPRSR